MPRAELAFAVNVIEHTPDPCAFLRALASHGELVAAVCPDAEVPGTEMLFADHLHSLRPEHLEALFARAGLSVERSVRAPAALGPFQLVAGRTGGEREPGSVWHAPTDDAFRYLLAWQSLDGTLCERLGSGEPIYAFGGGEAAGLLRAYTPAAWSRVRACIVDHPEVTTFGDLPVLDASAIAPATILLAVRPGVAQQLDARLREQGHRVIRWDDVIAA